MKVEVNYNDVVLEGFIKELERDGITTIILGSGDSGKLTARPEKNIPTNGNQRIEIVTHDNESVVTFLTQDSYVLKMIESGLDQIFFDKDPERPGEKYLCINKRRFIWIN